MEKSKALIGGPWYTPMLFSIFLHVFCCILLISQRPVAPFLYGESFAYVLLFCIMRHVGRFGLLRQALLLNPLKRAPLPNAPMGKMGNAKPTKTKRHTAGLHGALRNVGER